MTAPVLYCQAFLLRVAETIAITHKCLLVLSYMYKRVKLINTYLLLRFRGDKLQPVSILKAIIIDNRISGAILHTTTLYCVFILLTHVCCLCRLVPLLVEVNQTTKHFEKWPQIFSTNCLLILTLMKLSGNTQQPTVRYIIIVVETNDTYVHVAVRNNFARSIIAFRHPYHLKSN